MAKNSLNNSTVKPKSKLGQGFSSFHHTTIRLLGFEKSNITTIEDFQGKALHLAKSKHSDDMSLDLVIQPYTHLFHRYHDLINEEKLIDRMEIKANLRNTVFRCLTTLVIGFSIMLVYFVASCLEISMPLMKLPT